jgi:hypothetical protein
MIELFGWPHADRLALFGPLVDAQLDWCYREKNWTEAQRLLLEMVKHFPDHLPFQDELATVALAKVAGRLVKTASPDRARDQAARLERDIQEIEKLRAQFPDNLLLYDVLGQLCLVLAFEWTNGVRLAPALLAAAKALAYRPDWPEALRAQAQLELLLEKSRSDLQEVEKRLGYRYQFGQSTYVSLSEEGEALRQDIRTGTRLRDDFQRSHGPTTLTAGLLKATRRDRELRAGRQVPVDQQEEQSCPESLEGWTVGQRVLGRWPPDRMWYPGHIQDIANCRAVVKFDDGDTCLLPPRELHPHSLEVGSRVQARWKNGGQFYPGKIAEIHDDQIHIHYDDGDKEWTIPAMVRVERLDSEQREWKKGDRILACNPNDGLWYVAPIRSVKRKEFEVNFGGPVVALPPSQTAPLRLAAGAPVEARRQRGDTYYSGTLAQVNGTDIDIHYTDGHQERTTVDYLRLVNPADASGDPRVSVAASINIWAALNGEGPDANRRHAGTAPPRDLPILLALERQGWDLIPFDLWLASGRDLGQKLLAVAGAVLLMVAGIAAWQDRLARDQRAAAFDRLQQAMARWDDQVALAAVDAFFAVRPWGLDGREEWVRAAQKETGEWPNRRRRDEAYQRILKAAAVFDDQSAGTAAAHFLAALPQHQDEPRTDQVKKIQRAAKNWPNRRLRDSAFANLKNAQAHQNHLAVLQSAEQFLSAAPAHRPDPRTDQVLADYRQSFVQWFLTLGPNLDAMAQERIKRFQALAANR